MGNRARETGSGAAMLGILLLAVFFAANVRAEGLRAPFTNAAPQEPSGKSPGTVGNDGYEQKASRGAPVRDVPAVAAFRLEGGLGRCRHHLAADSSWSYRDWGNYENNMQVQPHCFQIGVSYLPLELGEVKLGIKGGFVDLGRTTADNTFPIDEPAYFRAKDSRTPVQSATGRFTGYGTHRGFTLGLAAEKELLGIHWGAETGLALLRNTWHVNFHGMNATAMTGCREDWACADGNQITPYIGLNARYRVFYVSVRQYESVHASNCDKNFQFIGPTSGTVTQVTAGISVAL